MAFKALQMLTCCTVHTHKVFWKNWQYARVTHCHHCVNSFVRLSGPTSSAILGRSIEGGGVTFWDNVKKSSLEHLKLEINVPMLVVVLLFWKQCVGWGDN